MTEPTNAQKEAARQARNAYLRAWRRKNPDKVKAMHEKYWIKKAEREAAKLEEEEARA